MDFGVCLNVEWLTVDTCPRGRVGDVRVAVDGAEGAVVVPGRKNKTKQQMEWGGANTKNEVKLGYRACINTSSSTRTSYHEV